MNERLELLRKRLSKTEQKREKFNWKTFWTASPTAWLALVISSITAFYTLVYYNDEVSVVMDKTSVFYKRDGKTVHFAKAFTVINSGTSPIALVQANVIVAPLVPRTHPHAKPLYLTSSD